MKKKRSILLTITVVVGVLLGTINVSASQTKKGIPDAEQYERSYDSDQVVHGDAQPAALPAFVAGALTGGAIYDAAKNAAKSAKNAHDKHSGSLEPKVDYQKKANQQGPWSVEDDYAEEFGR